LKTLTIEQKLWQTGIQTIAGIDEVGRGPLAGPVFACAVIFKPDYFLDGVKDSKKLSEKNRVLLSRELRKNAVTFSIGISDEKEIDKINIRQATFLAMKRALEKLTIEPMYVLVDGENIPDLRFPSSGIIKGDQRSFTISAASIIAKVERDNYMKNLDVEFPVYHFAKNKGYGTQEHIAALKMNGICQYHRKSFLSKILGANFKSGFKEIKK